MNHPEMATQILRKLVSKEYFLIRRSTLESIKGELELLGEKNDSKDSKLN